MFLQKKDTNLLNLMQIIVFKIFLLKIMRCDVICM